MLIKYVNVILPQVKIRIKNANNPECGKYPDTTNNLQFCDMTECRPDTCDWEYKPSP